MMSGDSDKKIYTADSEAGGSDHELRAKTLNSARNTLAESRKNSQAVIDSLNQQIFDLKKQVQSASLEMAMMRAQMDDLRKDAQKAAQLERFAIPDDVHMQEINETVAMIEKAIIKNRKKNRSSPPGKEENTSHSRLDERIILIVLKLRRRGSTVREIAAHTGLGIGTVHSIISKYGGDPGIQNLVTGGTQMEISDYLLIRPGDT